MSQIKSQPIDLPFQKLIAKVAVYYYSLALKNQADLNRYTSPKTAHQITFADRSRAIIGRRPNDISTWVNQISRSSNPKQDLYEYATKHIAWALDEFKFLPAVAKEFREMIKQTMGQEFVEKMDQVPL